MESPPLLFAACLMGSRSRHWVCFALSSQAASPHVGLWFADAAGGVALGYELVAGAGEVLFVRA